MSTKTWIGAATGDFNNAANWSPAGVPGAGDTVLVNTATDIAIAGNVSNTIDHLQLNAGATLDLQNGHLLIQSPTPTALLDPIAGVLTVEAGVLLIGAGALQLSGEIDLRGTDATLETAGDTLTLTTIFNQPNGHVHLTGGSIGGRVAVGGSFTFDTLALAGTDIDGFGTVGANGTLLDQFLLREGSDTIDANVSGKALVLRDSIFSPGGLLRASNGGTLLIEGGVIDLQSADPNDRLFSGKITVNAASTVVLDQGTITGGNLSVDPAGSLRIGTQVTLASNGIQTISVSGNLLVDPGATMVVTGLVDFDPPSQPTLDVSQGKLSLRGGTIAGATLLFAAAGLTVEPAGGVLLRDTLASAVTIEPGQTLTLADSATITGTVTVGGTLSGVAGHAAALAFTASGGIVQLLGGGVLALPFADDHLFGVAGASLELSQASIVGIGTIDQFAGVAIDSAGTLLASGGTLVLAASTVTNSGLLGAVAGSTLVVKGQVVNHGTFGSAGLIVFGGGGAGLQGGTLSAGSTIVVGAPGATFDGLENDGVILVAADATLTLTHAIANTGTLLLAGGGAAHPAHLLVNGTLAGGGTLLVGPNDIVDSTGTTGFVNLDNTIAGSGTLGTAAFNFINHGLVSATDSTYPLLVDPAGPTVRNLAVMQATAGTTLQVEGTVLDTDLSNGTLVDHGIGTLLATGAGAVVALFGGLVDRGLIRSVAGGQVQIQAAETLLLGAAIVVSGSETLPYVRDSALSLAADLRVLAGQTLTLANADTIADAWANNFGTIGVADGARLVIAAPTVELSAPQPGQVSGGPGTLTLAGPTALVAAAGTANILRNLETITGFGHLGDGALQLINGGLIQATSASGPLIVLSRGTLSNLGTLATAGGNLVLEGAVSGGALVSLGAGSFVLGGNGVAGSLGTLSLGVGARLTSSADGGTIGAAGVQSTSSGQVDIQSGQTITAFGTLFNNGTLVGGVVQPLGTTEIRAGGHLRIGGAGLTLQGSAGQILLDGPGASVDGVAGQTLVVDSGTLAGAGQIGSGAAAFSLLGANTGIVTATGTLAINTGAGGIRNVGRLVAVAGGELDLTGAVTNTGSIVAAGGHVVINSNVDGTGSLFLNGRGTLTLNDTVGASQTISFLFGSNQPDVLELTGTAIAGTLTFLQAQDTIDLLGRVATTATIDTSTGNLVIRNAGSLVAGFRLGVAPSAFNVLPDGHGGTNIVVACFVAGTRILTAAGEVAVEALRVGDLVPTVQGRLAPIGWIGRSEIDLDRHPRAARAAPIRVQRDALAPGVPHRDLLLSPDHSVLSNGALVPVHLLANGATIRREPARGVVAYFHVELPAHAVLLAEGLPAESYLDTGNRQAFADPGQSVRTLHPDFATPAAGDAWAQRGCAALLLGGRAVTALQRRLAARAWGRGLRRTIDPALQVLAPEGPLEPREAGPGRLLIRIPPGVRSLRLRSRSSVPNELDRTRDDHRRLGVAITALLLDASPAPAWCFAAGFHPHEQGDDAAWRWTDGDAVLALPEGSALLELHYATGWTQYWAEPAAPRQQWLREGTG